MLSHTIDFIMFTKHLPYTFHRQSLTRFPPLQWDFDYLVYINRRAPLEIRWAILLLLLLHPLMLNPEHTNNIILSFITPTYFQPLRDCALPILHKRSIYISNAVVHSCIHISQAYTVVDSILNLITIDSTTKFGVLLSNELKWYNAFSYNLNNLEELYVCNEAMARLWRLSLVVVALCPIWMWQWSERWVERGWVLIKYCIWLCQESKNCVRVM